MKDDKPWWNRPVYLDDSGLTPAGKRDRLYVLQDGKCGACRVPGLPRTAPGRKGKLFLDHDHYTGLVGLGLSSSETRCFSAPACGFSLSAAVKRPG